MYELIEGTTLNQRTTISSFVGNTLDISTSFDNGIMDIISDKRYQQITTHITNYAIELMEKSSSTNFHESLNFFEKCGFLSPIKQKYYEHQITLKKTTGQVSAYMLFNFMPTMFSILKKHTDIKNFKKVILMWMLYVNSGCSSHQIENFANTYLNINSNEYNKFLHSYVDSTNYNSLPKFNRTNKARLDSSERDNLLPFINHALSTCDFTFYNTDAKISEILCDCLGFSYQDAIKQIEIIKQGQFYTSQISLFSASLFNKYFSSLLGGFEKSIKLGKYNIENDFCRKERAKRKDLIVSASTTILQDILNTISCTSNNPLINNIGNLIIALSTNSGSNRFIELSEKTSKIKRDLS